MPRRNRVDPFGDLHAVPERGLLTGNRGCLVNDAGELVRHHRGSLWISCLLSYKDWKSPLSAPRHWTPLFFLDDAVALAAGHRPCGLCRPGPYRSYKRAVMQSLGTERKIGAADLNRLLGAERLKRGRGLVRASDRMVWTENVAHLPEGTVIVDDQQDTHLVMDDGLRRFDFSGWSASRPRPTDIQVTVLTPPTSVAALANGFSPSLHPSALPGPTPTA